MDHETDFHGATAPLAGYRWFQTQTAISRNKTLKTRSPVPDCVEFAVSRKRPLKWSYQGGELGRFMLHGASCAASPRGSMVGGSRWAARVAGGFTDGV